MANGKRWKITSHEVHATRAFYKRFISSLSEPVDCISICSPYFDKLPRPFGDIISFCKFLQRRGIPRIVVITGPPGAHHTAMTVETARYLDSQGIEFVIRASPYLHAKLYHLEYEKGHFRCFIGSSNFTLGGLDRNQELVAELEGVGPDSPCDRELARLVSGGGSMSFPLWVQRYQAKAGLEIDHEV